MSEDEQTLSKDESEHIRIAPELQDELRADALNENAGFAFVDKIRETDEADVIEVVFELPHGHETFSRKFARMRATNSDYPSIETLYDLDDEATLREPRSILYTSIPIVAEGDYRLPDLGEPEEQGMDPRVQEPPSANASWATKRDFYAKIDVDPKFKFIPFGVAALGFMIGLVVGGALATFLIWLVTAILAYGAYQWFDRLRVPDGAKAIEKAALSDVDVGDILILDQSGAQNPRDRTVVHVEAVKEGRIKGTLSSGQSVIVNPRRWYVEGPVGNNTHDNAYHLPKDQL